MTSIMRKLTYAAITGFILFGISFAFITGMVTATNGIAAAEGAVKPLFPQPYYEILISLAIGFIPVADVIWQHTKDKETEESQTQKTEQISALSNMMNGFIQTLKELKNDKTGRAGLHKRRKYYDPDPRRRSRRRGHRKGVEPAGLKRWRLAHKTHDPGRSHTYRTGPRGGHYFAGPKKRRYDPPHRRFGGARRAGGKLESIFNKYGHLLGFGIGAGAGVYQGYQQYAVYGKNQGRNYLATIIGGDIYSKDDVKLSTRIPEIAHLWTTEPNNGWNPVKYLKYKFLGLNDQDQFIGSSWVYPFWGGVIAALAGPVAKLFTNKGQRFLKPLHKIGIGLTAMSTVGALALPGSGEKALTNANGQSSLPPPPLNQNNQKIGGAF